MSSGAGASRNTAAAAKGRNPRRGEDQRRGKACQNCECYPVHHRLGCPSPVGGLEVARWPPQPEPAGRRRPARARSGDRLPYDVGQKPEKARPLDGPGKLTLLLGGNRGDAARARSCRARKCSAAAAARPCSRSSARSRRRRGSSCGGGRTADARLCLHGHQFSLPAGVPPESLRPRRTRAAIAARAVAEVAAPAAIAVAEAGHHRDRRTGRHPRRRDHRDRRERIIAEGNFLELLDPHRQVAQHVLVDRIWRSTSSRAADGASIFIRV